LKVCRDVVECIGNTPIIRLSKSIQGMVEAEIWGKMEFLNPTGSVKDRIALYMIKKAEERGELKPGMTIVVPTTGNTGIAFSAIASYLGYKVLIVIPEEMSLERFLLMKLFGAEFYFTPGGEVDAGVSLEIAKKLVSENPDKYYLFDQWSDEANVQAHYETTGREIIEQIGCPDAFIAQIGTGGTLIGVAKRLKEECGKILVAGAEPGECPVAYSWFHGLNSVKCERHEIEGVGDGFIPEIVKRYKHLIDDFILSYSNESIDMARRIARFEGLPVGISSGANVVAAVKLAKKYGFGRDKKIVTILPDYAARYFSTRLFLKERRVTGRDEILRDVV